MDGDQVILIIKLIAIITFLAQLFSFADLLLSYTWYLECNEKLT